MKRALITGVTGQDGSYLAERLLEAGYEVHGVIRRTSTFNTGRVLHLFRDPHENETRFFLHYGDLCDGTSIDRLISKLLPDEVYHLGAQSHVRVSFDMPIFTADTVAMSTVRLLEAIRNVASEKAIRFYQAGSSEMFGGAPAPQSERTAFQPRSPYACAKVMAHHLVVNYREAYGIYAVNGILFNHESPRRGETFVTRKITRGIARILAGKDKKIYLGVLDARRDWGFAGDYVDAMWRMLQQDKPDDYVVATGESHSVRDLLELAFGIVGRRYQDHVEVDARYFRPTEVNELCGDASKARAQLGWKPTVNFDALVRMMLAHDLAEEGLRLDDLAPPGGVP